MTQILESKAELLLKRGQYGFRRGLETRDAIAALHVLYGRSLEHNKKAYIYWIKLMKI